MSLTISDVSSANSTTSTSTLAVTGVTAAIGDMLLLACAADNAGTSGVASLSTTVTDSAGNTWVNQGGLINRTAGGAANDGTTLGLWTCNVTATLSGGTVTLNFSPNTTSKAAIVQKAVSSVGAAINVYQVGSGGTGSSNAWSSGTIAGVPNGYTLFAWSGEENSSIPLADVDTTNGSWSSRYSDAGDTGTATTSQSIAGQHKTVNATGDQSYDSGAAVSRDYAWNWLIIFEQAASFAVTEAADAAAFTAVHVENVSFAITEAADIAALVAEHGVSGTLAVSEQPDRAAFLVSPTWPPALPQPTLEAYSMKTGGAVRRDALDNGAPRVYRRSRPLAEVAVAWQLDAWQQMLFDGFYRAVVEEGGNLFGVELAFPGGLALATARFKGQVTMQALGGERWHATATLEVFNRPVMTADELDSALADDGDPPDWPEAFLPLPTLDSWALQPKPSVVRSEDLAGLPRQRQRSRNALTEADARWMLDPDQAPLFDAFVRWRARDGAQWFDLPLYEGIGFIDTKVRFIGDLDWQPLGGGFWSVAAPIEIREREVLSAAEYEVVVGVDQFDLFDAIDEMHRVVTEEIFP